MSVIHAPRRPQFDLRQAAFLGVVGVALLGFLARLWYLQVVDSDTLVQKATTLRTVVVKKLAPRGLITDRNGVLLAGVEPKWVVTAVPALIKKNPWALEKVAQLCGADIKKMQAKIDDSAWRPHFPTPIFVGVDIGVATRIAEAGEYLPGIDVDTQEMRTYADTTNFSHVMGYVWTPNAEDVKRLSALHAETPDYVGKNGIEREYERQLQGERGFDRFEVDNKRRPKRTVESRAPVPGQKLVLSLDADLQRYATATMQGFKGSVVALDPNTGEILAIVSSPTFDTSLFAGGISSSDYDALAKDPGIPLMNRAMGGKYPPGSTFKIITTIAWAMSGKFDARRTFYCPGYYKIGKKKTKCLGTHGPISYHRAFEKSCNTYFASIGRDAGIENLRKAAEAFRLGKFSDVDLPGESRGSFPYQAWLDYRKLDLYPGDVVNTSIGQGYVAATPLQMASVAAQAATMGVMYKPHLVHAMIAPNSSQVTAVQPEVASRIDVPPNVWAELKSAMVAVIESGTARTAQIPGLRWGGKTGSSEHQTGEKTHGWFVGFAPIDDPKIAIAVVIESRGHGGDVAAPIAKAVVQHYFFRPKTAPRAATNAASAASSDAFFRF